MSAERFCRVCVTLTVAIAVLAGCNDNSVTPPVDDNPPTKPGCMDCHGDADVLKDLLPAKSDGIGPAIADDG